MIFIIYLLKKVKKNIIIYIVFVKKYRRKIK